MTSSAETKTHHGLVSEAPKAGQRKHAFNHDRTAQHGAGLQSDQGHHRQQRVAQHVANHHAGLVQPLGAGGADEIQVQHLEHRCAHDAQIDRNEDQPQRQRRQHQMTCDIDGVPDSDLDGADILKAAGRQPLQIDGKHHDRHQPEPERRRRVEDQPDCRDQRIRPLIDPARGDDAEHETDKECKGQRGRHQQDGRRQPLQNN
jgi:hypothetical protein